MEWLKKIFRPQNKEEELYKPIHINLEKDGIVIGKVKSVVMTGRKDNYFTGHCDGLLFKNEYINDVFKNGIIKVKFQQTSLTFKILEKTKNGISETEINNVWIIKITGMIYKSKSYTMISSHGPSEPWPEDGKTYWVSKRS